MSEKPPRKPVVKHLTVTGKETACGLTTMNKPGINLVYSRSKVTCKRCQSAMQDRCYDWGSR